MTEFILGLFIGWFALLIIAVKAFMKISDKYAQEMPERYAALKLEWKRLEAWAENKSR